MFFVAVCVLTLANMLLAIAKRSVSDTFERIDQLDWLVKTSLLLDLALVSRAKKLEKANKTKYLHVFQYK